LFSPTSFSISPAPPKLIPINYTPPHLHLHLNNITTEYLPKSVLECTTVAREIVFSSVRSIDDFHIYQQIFFHGQLIEEWYFRFGFVIPGSTNSWEQTIEAAAKEKMMAADVLSGNLVIKTSFYDADICLGVNRVRIFYE
jgi:retinal rod rhodopsin-sensitive cGMP 3',5'-cyclic phosphodiesterase subunit delta